DTKRFRLADGWSGLDVLEEGFDHRLADRARPAMDRFALASEAAVGLWKMVSADRMQLLVHSESDAGMRLRLADAQRQPLGGGAVGRALAAAQRIDARELARRYAGVRWLTNLPLETYIAQVGEAVRQGYAVDRENTHRSVISVAVGVAERASGYCLSASIFANARLETEIGELGEQLKTLSEEIFPVREPPRRG